jgi:hypothetical protein
MRVSRRSLVVLVACVLSLAASCPPAGMDPAAQRAYWADQVLDRVGNLQDAAIAANVTLGDDGQQLLADGPAVQIVRFTTGAIKALDDVPGGWPETILAGVEALRDDLSPEAFSIIDTALAALEALVRGGTGGVL